ncbi:MAG: TetR/AcrR family transcriptional regulator [Pseudomonadota bacterium]|nr:TetR/AcrR family transcriptional regulator [Pseudomonadota bacterium]
MTHANSKRRGRPPKTDYRIGTQEGDARAALIASGLETLTEHGYLGAGLEGILKRAGVPKGSFYHYFASKEAFGQAVMERYASYFAGKLERHLEDASQPPLARLLAFAEDAKAGMARHGYRRGCLVGNLGQEAAGLPSHYREWLIETLADWQQRLAACLEEARQRGDIAGDSDCMLLAEAFWIGWEGAIMRARLERGPRPIDVFTSHFLAGLQTTSPAP